MNRVCQHCGELIVGNPYRVTSEEEGITLLDMIVCSLCFMEAKDFTSTPTESPFAARNLIAAFL